MGNLHSVKKTLDRMGANAFISSDPQALQHADKIILPGVGHFATAMNNLNALHLSEELHEAVQVKKIPVLGICLGMQLMATHSEEGNIKGLGWFDATVVKFNVEGKSPLKVPHMGWNSANPTRTSPLTHGLSEEAEFYFVHAYHWKSNTNEEVIQQTTYGYSFPSAIQQHHIFAVQYHPEKSHEYGVFVLKNFIQY